MTASRGSSASAAGRSGAQSASSEASRDAPSPAAACGAMPRRYRSRATLLRIALIVAHEPVEFVHVAALSAASKRAGATSAQRFRMLLRLGRHGAGERRRGSHRGRLLRDIGGERDRILIAQHEIVGRRRRISKNLRGPSSGCAIEPARKRRAAVMHDLDVPAAQRRPGPGILRVVGDGGVDIVFSLSSAKPLKRGERCR